MEVQNILVIIAGLVYFTGAELEAIISKSRLPFQTSHTKAIYDGDDSIFIFGGDLSTSSSSNAILRYQISTDQIRTVAVFPTGRYAGGISCDSSGNIFYFGGANASSFHQDVFKFIPLHSTLEQLPDLEAQFADGSVLTNPDSPDIAYLFGKEGSSTPDSIYCYNMSSAKTCGETEITVDNTFRKNSAFSIGERAFVFATWSDILLLNLTSLKSTLGETELPSFEAQPTVVTDGNYGYFVAGWGTSTHPPTPLDSIIKFNPDTLAHEIVHVKNHPVLENQHTFHSSSAVYVEKFNRIYVFGGYSFGFSGTRWYSNIWYIDLSPITPTFPTTALSDTTTLLTTFPTDYTTQPPTTTLHPDFFTCDGKPNGMYPHPFDCSLYIGCYNEQLTIHSCSPPLLFNPVTSGCDFPEEVDCQLSCNGKPNGFYPHPHSCALYIGCHDGATEIHKCSFPLLFDPDLLTCWFPEEVNCSVM